MLDKLIDILRDVKPVALVLGVVLIVRTVAAEPYHVPTSSMVPTIHVGDTLVASKFAYGYSKYSSPLGLMPDFEGRVLDHAPERGDVIVFRLPRDTSTTYVKRLIGLPGDRVQMQGGRLYINDALVPREPIGAGRYRETLPGGRTHEIIELSDTGTSDDTPAFQIKPGEYFMMGDNRDSSLDSRTAAAYGGVGPVPAENLIGRADVVLFSHDPEVPWWNVAAWPRAFGRFFTRIG